MSKKATGHLAVLITILIWGTTFISTKVLLVDFEPIEILFFRFVLGFLALLIVYPHRMRGTTKRQEIVFAAAGLCGVCLYYLLENIALTYTMASNVGVIISIAPFFTAMLTHMFTKEEKPRGNFFIGFIVAMVGICLISFNGAKMQLNPIGDLLAVSAAFVWACYSVLTRKISGWGYHTIQTTRRVFAYGIIFMIPALFLFDCRIGAERFANPVFLGNLKWIYKIKNASWPLTRICRLALSQIRRLSWESPWEKRCRRWSVQMLQTRVETNILESLSFPCQF